MWWQCGTWYMLVLSPPAWIWNLLKGALLLILISIWNFVLGQPVWQFFLYQKIYFGLDKLDLPVLSPPPICENEVRKVFPQNTINAICAPLWSHLLKVLNQDGNACVEIRISSNAYVGYSNYYWSTAVASNIFHQIQFFLPFCKLRLNMIIFAYVLLSGW